MAFSTVLLSGSTNGRNIKVAATSTPGTTIHTAHATSLDELYIYATNTSASDVLLTLEIGGTTSPDDQLKVTIPAQAGNFPVLEGRKITGSVVLKAFAATGDVINISGDVIRIA